MITRLCVMLAPATLALSSAAQVNPIMYPASGQSA